jgi:hypothetical protein
VGNAVGIFVSVLVGVNNSAPSAVTVGVNVSGVGVAVANRFCVGIGVSLIDGVGVSLAGTGVGETSSGGKLGIAEQPARVTSRRTWMSLFIMNLCVLRCMLKG